MTEAERIYNEFVKVKSQKDFMANVRVMTRQFMPEMDRELRDFMDTVDEQAKLYEPWLTGDPRVAKMLKQQNKEMAKALKSLDGIMRRLDKLDRIK
ncbi:MAG: hypothetical protein CBD18_02455 [Opitutales bacterium TMED158]|nr:MAG: hypothetical protein CBD18_02455 [Opitutales bacterium TMED158]|tara:strand:+ start:558 stop:845 length:288 start_codon:yes stop_codon:yes gene_type:complete